MKCFYASLIYNLEMVFIIYLIAVITLPTIKKIFFLKKNYYKQLWTHIFSGKWVMNT